jgi:CRISPR/Cas system CSM-associated protein Csm4 (group 5 of RAMP superfamily)
MPPRLDNEVEAWSIIHIVGSGPGTSANPRLKIVVIAIVEASIVETSFQGIATAVAVDKQSTGLQQFQVRLL